MEKNVIANMKQGLLGTRDWDSFQAIMRKAHGALHKQQRKVCHIKVRQESRI